MKSFREIPLTPPAGLGPQHLGRVRGDHDGAAPRLRRHRPHLPRERGGQAAGGQRLRGVQKPEVIVHLFNTESEFAVNR